MFQKISNCLRPRKIVDCNKINVVNFMPQLRSGSYYFTNYDKETVSGNLKILENIFPIVNNKILISPKDELGKLGLSPSSYRVVFSFRSDIIGSFDTNSSKLVISEISPSRTEIKVRPECLKNSAKPSDVAINVELISPIAMEEGMRFAIREGGRTVGSGVVSKIVQ